MRATHELELELATADVPVNNTRCRPSARSGGRLGQPAATPTKHADAGRFVAQLSHVGSLRSVRRCGPESRADRTRESCCPASETSPLKARSSSWWTRINDVRNQFLTPQRAPKPSS